MTNTLKTKQLEHMKLELGNSKDKQLSLAERIGLWFNKNLIDGGEGSGFGYNCVTCKSQDMTYFKREFELNNASWDQHYAAMVVVPPIESAQLPAKVFYLMGRCNDCHEEQQVSNRPNRTAYWQYESSM